MKRVLYNLGRICRFITIAPLFIPYMIVIFCIGSIANILDRDLRAPFIKFFEYSLWDERSFLNKMADYINWDY